jgi:hypothetical protein
VEAIYVSLGEWQPLDSAKRLDIWLAVNVMGWHAHHGAWGPSWRYHDTEMATVNPELADVWTGFWAFETRVKEADQTDDAHKIYRIEEGEIKLSYSPGQEWVPTGDPACCDLLKTRVFELGFDWEVIGRSGSFTIKIFKGDIFLSEGTGNNERLIFCEVIKSAIFSSLAPA